MCRRALDGLNELCDMIGLQQMELPAAALGGEKYAAVMSGAAAEDKPGTARTMVRHASMPNNMYSQIQKRRWELLEAHNPQMHGHCILKSSPKARKEMHVQMTVANGDLSIKFEQQNKGRWQSFQLCRLTVKDLVICYSHGNTRGFCIAAPWKGILEVCIYCSPCDNRTNTWLLFLQKTGARMQLIRDMENHSSELSPVEEV